MKENFPYLYLFAGLSNKKKPDLPELSFLSHSKKRKALINQA